MSDESHSHRPTTRVDPIDEVRRLLASYPGPARTVFRMHFARLVADPEYSPKARNGSVEKAFRKVRRMLLSHPEMEAKREAIRCLLL